MKINQIKNVVLPLLLLFCLIGCSEDKEPQTYPPTLVTNSAAELTRFRPFSPVALCHMQTAL